MALRSGSHGYVAKDMTGEFYFPDEQGKPTRVRMVLPAGSQVQTGSSAMTDEQIRKAMADK